VGYCGLPVYCVGPDRGFNHNWITSIKAQITEVGTGELLAITVKHLKTGKVIPVTLTAKTSEDRNKETVWKTGGENLTIVSGRIN